MTYFPTSKPDDLQLRAFLQLHNGSRARSVRVLRVFRADGAVVNAENDAHTAQDQRAMRIVDRQALRSENRSYKKIF